MRREPEGKRKAESGKRERPVANGGPSKNRVKRIEQIEREIAAAEAALSALEDELADPSSWSSPTATERNSKRHADARAAVEALYAQLETAGA